MTREELKPSLLRLFFSGASVFEIPIDHCRCYRFGKIIGFVLPAQDCPRSNAGAAGRLFELILDSDQLVAKLNSENLNNL